MNSLPRFRRRALAPLAALCLLAPLGLLAPRPGAAIESGTPLYRVEVIVFRTSAAPVGEDWSVHPPGRGFGVNPGHADSIAELARQLPAGDFRLAGIAARLRTSGAWRVVAHAAWIQSAGTWGTHMGLPLEAVGLRSPDLQGTVYLERAPIYLHLGFDVGLRGGSSTYWIDEMRSVKYGNRMYFDHPGFGIIAEVLPIKAP